MSMETETVMWGFTMISFKTLLTTTNQNRGFKEVQVNCMWEGYFMEMNQNLEKVSVPDRLSRNAHTSLLYF